MRCQKESFPQRRPHIDVVRLVGASAENFPVPRRPRKLTSVVGVWGLTRDGMQRGVQFHSSHWMPQRAKINGELVDVLVRLP